LFYRLYEEAQQAAVFKTDEQINELKADEVKLAKLAKAKGLSLVQMYDKYLTQNYEVKDATGKVIRTEIRLIDRFDKDLRSELRKLLDKEDKKAVREFVNKYVNIEEYQKDYEKRKAERFAEIEKTIYHAEEVDNVAERKRRKEEYIAQYDITKPSSLISANRRLFYHMNENAHSKEYQELQKEPLLLALYNKQIESNKIAAEKKMIEWRQIYSFVPNVRKGFIDNVLNKSFDPFKAILDSVRVDPSSDPMFGAIDPITRQPIDKIPVNYVYELDAEAKSREFLKTLALWQKEINEYSWRSELETYTKLLTDVEKRKGTLTKDGKIIPKGENDKNTEYLEKFVDYYIYNKKLGSDDDFTATINLKKIAEKINSKLGFKLLSEQYAEGEEEITVSATKAVQAANRFFQMKVLGLNITTALSNLVGGTANAVINSEKYFTKAEFLNKVRIFPGMMKAGKDGELYARLIDYFMPLVENTDRIKIEQLNSTKLGEYMTSDILFALQRGSDKMVTYPMLLAMLENTAVVDGKLVNIIDYVRTQNGYLSRFNMKPEERNALLSKIDQEIAKMKEKSVIKTAKIIDNKLVIDGVERNDPSVAALRSKIQALGRKVMGSASTEDIAQYRMTLLGQTFMMFKNWIPNLALVRFGGLKENAKGDWEYGRLRLMYKMIADNGFKAFKTLRDVMQLNPEGVAYMREIYRKKLDEFVAQNNDEEEFLSEEEFMELYTQGIKMAVTEVKFWIAMAGIVTGAGYAIDTDDPDDEMRGVKKFALRSLDKMKDELAFFFDPRSFTDIANGNIFPALGTVTDGMKFFSHWGKQSAGYLFGNEEWEEEAKPLKYMFKTMPITKEMLTYIAIFNQDLADDMGIRMSSQYSVR
jgi:hypothetical protein